MTVADRPTATVVAPDISAVKQQFSRCDKLTPMSYTS